MNQKSRQLGINLSRDTTRPKTAQYSAEFGGQTEWGPDEVTAVIQLCNVHKQLFSLEAGEESERAGSGSARG